jgi:hypothetical protein
MGDFAMNSPDEGGLRLGRDFRCASTRDQAASPLSFDFPFPALLESRSKDRLTIHDS